MTTAAVIFAIVGTGLIPAAAAQTLNISQVKAEANEFVVFLDAGDVQSIEPAHLSATFGKQPLTVAEVRKFDPAQGVAYIVLVDISKSLGAKEFAQVRTALGTFVDGMQPADRLALLSFGDEVQTLADFTADKAALKTKLGALGPAANKTVLHQGLKQGLLLGARLDRALPLRRAMVVLTDGRDEGSGLTADDVVAELNQNRVPVYALGASRLPAQEKAKYLDVLVRIAGTSGGWFLETSEFGGAYEKVREKVSGVFQARMRCGTCAADARSEHLRVTLEHEGKVMAAGLDVRLLPGAATQPAQGSRGPWVIGVAVALLLGGSAAVLSLRRPAPAATPVAGAEPVMREPEPPVTPPPAATSERAAGAAASAGPRLQLVVVRGDHPGATYELTVAQRAVIGTSADSQVRVHGERTMSGRHFELSRDRERILIRDLGSTNGTLLNGAPLRAAQPLADGDLITAGFTELRVNLA
jgi:hypothetical protein